VFHKNISDSVNQSFNQSIKFTKRILNLAYRPTVFNYCLFPVISYFTFAFSNRNFSKFAFKSLLRLGFSICLPMLNRVQWMMALLYAPIKLSDICAHGRR